MPTGPRLRWLSAALAIAAWMLLAHPYEGLRHDGVLYFGQALMRSSVPALAQDVFFVAGSQDRYSIYSHVMAPLYAQLGLAATHVSVLLLTWALLLSGVAVLLVQSGRSRAATAWGVLAFAVLSPTYGGGWVFAYGAPFVTARSFAEPLLLWSLVALLAHRPLAVAALQLLAALFHPLMALPIIAATWCYLVAGDRRWLWALAVVPAALLAALFNLSPWDGLLKTYDPDWWSQISRNPYLLIGNWTIPDLLNVALDLAVLLLVTRLAPRCAGTRLFRAVAMTTVAFMGLAAVAVDLCHSVLFTQLQLWRAHWIAHLLAVTASPWLLCALWRMGGLWKASACALALALLNAHIGTGHDALALALWALLSLAAWQLPRASTATVGVACACVAGAIVGLSAGQLVAHLQQQAWQFPQAGWADRFITFGAFPAVVATCFGASLWLAKRQRGEWLTLALAMLLLMAAVKGWDQRSDLAKAIEATPPGSHPFTSLMRAEATVFWPEQLAAVWGPLGRPSHYTVQQGAGVLFHRNTALIYGPRRERYRPITEDHARCSAGALLARDRVALAACEMPAAERLTGICGHADAPEFLVLPGRLAPRPLASWRPPANRDLPQTLNLYACTQLTARNTRP